MDYGQGQSISLRHTILIWVCLGSLASALSLLPAGQWFERTIVREWIFELRGVRPTPRDVLIVSMDKSGADLPSLVRGDRLWSRHLY